MLLYFFKNKNKFFKNKNKFKYFMDAKLAYLCAIF